MANNNRVSLKPCSRCLSGVDVKLFNHAYKNSEVNELEVRCFKCNFAMFNEYSINIEVKEIKPFLVERWNSRYEVRRQAADARKREDSW
jgi:hypothetical protein